MVGNFPNLSVALHLNMQAEVPVCRGWPFLSIPRLVYQTEFCCVKKILCLQSTRLDCHQLLTTDLFYTGADTGGWGGEAEDADRQNTGTQPAA